MRWVFLSLTHTLGGPLFRNMWDEFRLRAKSQTRTTDAQSSLPGPLLLLDGKQLWMPMPTYHWFNGGLRRHLTYSSPQSGARAGSSDIEIARDGGNRWDLNFGASLHRTTYVSARSEENSSRSSTARVRPRSNVPSAVQSGPTQSVPNGRILFYPKTWYFSLDSSTVLRGVVVWMSF